jgi:Fe-S-cluster containining protein
MLEDKKAHYCSVICKAWCCRYLVCDYTPFDNSGVDELFLSVRHMQLKENKVIIPSYCKWLNNHNKCKLYTMRPKSCMVYECEDLKRIK